MDPKQRDLHALIKQLEEEITKGQEYLESGKHADWHGLRPLFVPKRKEGKQLPPHKGWVRSTYIPRREKALRKAQDALDRVLERDSATHHGQRS